MGITRDTLSERNIKRAENIFKDIMCHVWIDDNLIYFYRIRLNDSSLSSEYLLVPVEVQVSSAPGVYSPQDSLDFGLMVSSDKPKTISLLLINAQVTPVNVQVSFV